MSTKVAKESIDIIQEKIASLKQIIPECFTEGNRVDVERLEKTLGESLEKNNEKYSFNWAGRNNTFRNIQIPSKASLLPVREESINFDDTENLFVEGDNLEVLKLLQRSYFGKIKLIYIDPPYNTGKDFIYKDDFHNSIQSYLEQTEQVEDGIKLTTNPETSGRFHSDWISMMYSRLFLARNLLSEDGIIFVSIDDNESHNLRMIMNEIFGEENFVADIVVVNNLKGRNDKAHIALAHERLMIFKNPTFIEEGLELTEKQKNEFDLTNESGRRYRLLGLRKRGGADTRAKRPKLFYPIYINEKTGKVSTEKKPQFTVEVIPKKSDNTDGCWRWGQNAITIKNDLLVGIKSKSGKWDVFQIDYIDKGGEERRIKPKSVWFGSLYSTDSATKEFKKIMGECGFNNPKSVYLLKDIVSYATEDEDIILDFFAGSATLAHAVLEKNLEDGGHRKFICVQLPEKIENKIDKNYDTIADIAKERIRRVIKALQKEAKQKLIQKNIDLGFKVFKLAKSNFKIWENYDGNDSKKLKEQMKLFQSPLTAEAKELGVIYECMIKEGFNINSKIEKTTITTNTIFRVSDADSFFYITLDKTIKDVTIDKLNLSKNDTFICIDAALDDSKKTNLSKQCELKTL